MRRFPAESFRITTEDLIKWPELTPELELALAGQPQALLQARELVSRLRANVRDLREAYLSELEEHLQTQKRVVEEAKKQEKLKQSYDELLKEERKAHET